MTETTKSTPRRLLRRKPVLLALAVLLVAAAGVYLFAGNGGGALVYRTAKVVRGAITSAVSASGTLKAVVTVDVGSQVSGQIKALLADYNTEVKAGQVIARLDPATFKAKLLQAEAELAVAKGTVASRKAGLAAMAADIKAAEAGLAEAKRELARKRELVRRRVVSTADVDRAVAAHDQAVAKLDSARAKLRQEQAQVEIAHAQVQQKEASVAQARLDLDHTVIRSPVDGVVIARSVSVGQTVAASLQAPVLFTIAQDLRSMQVEVSVDEADIGRIRDGQTANFSVDAYPGRRFPGTVRQIRKEPKVESNVVTYTVVVTAANPDLRLLPGMTANVNFIVNRRDNALKVPNSALRFRPAGASRSVRSNPGGARAAIRPGSGRRFVARLTKRLNLTADQQAELRSLFADMRGKIAAMRRGGAGRDELRAEIQKLRARNRSRILAILTPEQRDKFRALGAARAANPVRRGQVWVRDGQGGLKPVTVWTGISDGGATEIVRGDLREGQEVVTGASRAGSGRSRGPRLGF